MYSCTRFVTSRVTMNNRRDFSTRDLISLLIAKFHYTGPTEPARTRTDPNDPDLRETPLVRAGLRQSAVDQADLCRLSSAR